MLEFSRREKWFIGVIYGLPIACLCAALVVAFAHAQNWASRHNSGDSWEHLAFAIMIELPALFGILLMTLWPKIGGGRKKTVPRLLFGSAVVLSFYVQQAYAGSGASGSERFVAGAPSILAGAFLELVFWVMGLVEEAKAAAKAEAAGPPPAAVLPPPPLDIPMSPLAAGPPTTHVPPSVAAPVPQDTALLSPWTEPPRTPALVADVPQDITGGQGDIPQLTALVPPPASPSAGGEDTGGQALPDPQDTGDLSPTVPRGHDPQDSTEGDTDAEGDSEGDTTPASKDGAGLDPTDLEVWAHFENGKTKKDLAAMYQVSEKTIQRRLQKVRAATAAVEEHANA